MCDYEDIGLELSDEMEEALREDTCEDCGGNVDSTEDGCYCENPD